MNDERFTQVLQMVADHKVSVAEAQELLDALSLPEMAEGREPTAQRRAPDERRLRVGVYEHGNSVAETRVPLALLRADRNYLPREIRHYLATFEVDLDQLLQQANELGLSGTLTELTRENVHLLIGLK
jgi:hypothetical protein